MTRPKAAHTWAQAPDQWYQEPIAASAALFARELFEGRVWDPSCGAGNIVHAALAAGLDAVGSDIVDRTSSPPWFAGIRDFLTDEGPPLAPNVVNNPPFFKARGTEAFIRRALALATRKVCIFADVKFLASQRRGTGLWQEHPPSRVWILTERPSCPPGEYLAAGNRARGGTADWAWYVWDVEQPAAVGETRLGWLLPTKPPDTLMNAEPLPDFMDLGDEALPDFML